MKKVILFLSVIFVISLSGCSGNSEQVKLMDTVGQIKGMEDYNPTGTLAQSFYKNVYYEISDITWKDNVGVAEVKTFTPDLEEVIFKSIQRAIEEYGTDDYTSLLEKVKKNIQMMLNSNDYSIIKSTVEMEAEKTENAYILINNESFERIISGNLEEIFIKTLMEEFANEKQKK